MLIDTERYVGLRRQDLYSNMQAALPIANFVLRRIGLNTLAVINNAATKAYVESEVPGPVWSDVHHRDRIGRNLRVNGVPEWQMRGGQQTYWHTLEIGAETDPNVIPVLRAYLRAAVTRTAMQHIVTRDLADVGLTATDAVRNQIIDAGTQLYIPPPETPVGQPWVPEPIEV